MRSFSSWWKGDPPTDEWKEFLKRMGFPDNLDRVPINESFIKLEERVRKLEDDK